MKLAWGAVLVNRALWVLGAAVLLASAVLAGYWSLEPVLRAPRPLELPALDSPSAPAPFQIAQPERNPFDVAGTVWRAPTAARAAQVPALADLRGVIASQALSGVFTTNGLVKVGEPFAGGTLESVSREGLVLRMPDGTEKRLQPENKDDKVRAQLLQLWAEAAER